MSEAQIIAADISTGLTFCLPAILFALAFKHLGPAGQSAASRFLLTISSAAAITTFLFL